MTTRKTSTQVKGKYYDISWRLAVNILDSLGVWCEANNFTVKKIVQKQHTEPQSRTDNSEWQWQNVNLYRARTLSSVTRKKETYRMDLVGI